MPLPKVLPHWLMHAAERAGNPGFKVAPEGWGVIEMNGQEIRLGLQKEEVKIDLMLDCGVHMRYCTVNAIGVKKDLLCRYCHSNDELMAVDKRPPSRYERLFFEAMQDKGLAGGLRPEVHLGVQLGGWSGLIDFYDRSSGVLVQVDGEQHFTKTWWCVPRTQVMEADVNMCMHAIRAGRVLVRVHYRDVLSGGGPRLVAEVMKEATAKSRGHLVVLSSHFNLSDPTNTKTVAKQQRFMVALEVNLRTAGYHFHTHHDAENNIWIQAVPPAAL